MNQGCKIKYFFLQFKMLLWDLFALILVFALLLPKVPKSMNVDYPHVITRPFNFYEMEKYNYHLIILKW